MRTLIASATASAVALIALAGCSTAPATPSLDQQQQAWEETVRTRVCETITALTPGSLELGWAIENAAKGNLSGDDLAAFGTNNSSRRYNCNDAVFDRYYQEWLVEDFPESPKGQAGETTKPSAP